MKVTLLLAEYAKAEPDGTFTAIRCGISRFTAGRPLQVTAVVHVRHDVSEAGKHPFRFAMVDADGKRIAPDIVGELEMAAQGGRTTLAIQMQANPKAGNYDMQFALDGQLVGSIGFSVTSTDKAQGAPSSGT